MIKIFEIEVDSGRYANLTNCNVIRKVFAKDGNWNVNVKEVPFSTLNSGSNSSSYQPYSIEEIGAFIEKIDKTGLCFKCAHFLKDAFIRLEKLENRLHNDYHRRIL